MSDVSGIIAVWRRELIVFKREVSRLISALISPLMWILLFGGGMNTSLAVDGVGYQSYIFPGIVVMSVLFTSTFYGIYIIWDRKIDVLKAVLVAPVSRLAIFIGKVLGGCTDAILQTLVLLLVGFWFVSYTAWGFALALAVVGLTATGFVALGLAIGAFFESFEGFQLVSTFLTFPLFFLSGALYPLEHAPLWLRILSRIDPVTYAVDAMRFAMLGKSVWAWPLDILILFTFAAMTIVFGSFSFRRMK
jgi:ABC-2 type transport system permease protein